jgi:hypothetical protein
MTSYIEIIVFTAFIVFMALDGFYSEALRVLRVLKVLGAFRALCCNGELYFPEVSSSRP